MKILIVHNRYQIPGGEDVVVAQETALLRAHGLDVQTFIVDNDTIATFGEKMKTAAQVAYSWQMRGRIAKVLARFQPDIMHVHNFFPRLSPSIYDAAAAVGCPVVQTIHNYRLLCPGATLFRDGKVCLDCAGKTVAWPSVQHRCYRGSAAASASVAFMLAANHLRGAWSRRVDRFLMLTEFARDFFLEHTNIPAAAMLVKPNAAEDPGLGTAASKYALFVGRLSPEKGIDVLLEAAMRGLGLPLKIAGQGPLTSRVQQAHAAGQVEYLGPQSTQQIRSLMQDAAFLLVPSLWYEGLPMVIPEAFGTGLPVIASSIGSLASLIDPGVTGLLVAPGDASALSAAAMRLASDRTLLAGMRLAARARYMASYQPENNYQLLLAAYHGVMAARRPVLPSAIAPGAAVPSVIYPKPSHL